MEGEVLATSARLRAAERLADAVESSASVQPPEVVAALRAFRAAGE
jgi:hypothetical protein